MYLHDEKKKKLMYGNKTLNKQVYLFTKLAFVTQNALSHNILATVNKSLFKTQQHGDCWGRGV